MDFSKVHFVIWDNTELNLFPDRNPGNLEFNILKGDLPAGIHHPFRS
jgi:hypothetical protein